MADGAAGRDNRLHLFRSIGPTTLASLAEAVAAERGEPVDSEELEVVAAWARDTWAAEVLIDMVLDGQISVFVKDGKLTFRGRPPLETPLE